MKYHIADEISFIYHRIRLIGRKEIHEIWHLKLYKRNLCNTILSSRPYTYSTHTLKYRNIITE